MENVARARVGAVEIQRREEEDEIGWGEGSSGRKLSKEQKVFVGENE